MIYIQNLFIQKSEEKAKSEATDLILQIGTEKYTYSIFNHTHQMKNSFLPGIPFGYA